MRVENVDVQGIIKEQLTPGGWKKLGDEMPVDASGQTLEHTHPPQKWEERSGEEKLPEADTQS